MPGIKRAGAIGAILLTGGSSAKSFAQQILKREQRCFPGCEPAGPIYLPGNPHGASLSLEEHPFISEHSASFPDIPPRILLLYTYVWNWRVVSLGCVADSVVEGKPVEVSSGPHLLPPLPLKELPDGPGETAGPGEPVWGSTCAAILWKMSEASQRAPGCAFCGKHPSGPGS